MKGSTRFAIGTLLKIVAIIIIAALALWLLAGIYGKVIIRLAGGLG